MKQSSWLRLSCAAPAQVFWWHEKHKPRRPKYFNRVHTGYEWNKYNQTHYDHDNPPPKTVQVRNGPSRILNAFSDCADLPLHTFLAKEQLTHAESGSLRLSVPHDGRCVVLMNCFHLLVHRATSLTSSTRT